MPKQSHNTFYDSIFFITDIHDSIQSFNLKNQSLKIKKMIQSIFYQTCLHNSPVYPISQPVSHFPVVLLHATWPKQFPLHLYAQSGP